MNRNLSDAQESLSFLEILYPAIIVYIWPAFASNPIIVLIEIMITRRNATRRLEEEVSNARAPPHGNQVPPLQEKGNVDQAPANPPPMTEAYMRAILAQMAQAITTQAQATTF